MHVAQSARRRILFSFQVFVGEASMSVGKHHWTVSDEGNFSWNADGVIVFVLRTPVSRFESRRLILAFRNGESANV